MDKYNRFSSALCIVINSDSTVLHSTDLQKQYILKEKRKWLDLQLDVKSCAAVWSVGPRTMRK